MLTSFAFVPTASAGKYLTQLCKHWSHKLPVELDEGQRGVVRFEAAMATFDAEPETLRITLEAADPETLERMKGVISSHLDRFAFREAPLTFDWT